MRSYASNLLLVLIWLRTQRTVVPYAFRSGATALDNKCQERFCLFTSCLRFPTHPHIPFNPQLILSPCLWFASISSVFESTKSPKRPCQMYSPPRPILKRPEHSYSPGHHPGAPTQGPHPHAVHFPPSPSLTRTFSAYSSSAYDRSPIVVAPNSCALPERGGRTYTLEDHSPHPSSYSNARRAPAHNGRDLHPRALAFNSHVRSLPHGAVGKAGEVDDAERTPTRTFPALPKLIPDLSSESDESDGFISPPPEPLLFPPVTTIPHHPSYSSRNLIHGPSIANPASHNKYPSYTPRDMYNHPSASQFLPHAPSPTQYQQSYHEDESQQKSRRRRDRRRERPRESDRVGGLEDEDEDAEGVHSSKRSGPYKPLSMCKALSSFSIDDPDSGCLGGF